MKTVVKIEQYEEFSKNIEDYPKFNYSKYLRKCIRICKRCKINISEIIDSEVEFVKKNDCYAYCEKEKPGYKIFITTLFYDQYKNKIEALENILLHELCHTIKGCFNHGKKWKENVLKLNEHGFKINPHPYTNKQSNLY